MTLDVSEKVYCAIVWRVSKVAARKIKPSV